MKDDTAIILDPVNVDLIRDAFRRDLRTFAGGSCTVSLMLMVVGSLSMLASWSG
jgi:aspartate-semialdehyde dehydrogenase